MHRIVLCPYGCFQKHPEAILQWESPCLGVSEPLHKSFISNILHIGKEIPLHSGTCNVSCYHDPIQQVDYFIPAYGEWRIEHHAREQVTYAYSDGQSNMFDGLLSMLIHVIGSQYGYYPVFASCVAVKGEALLFMGEGGVGKTTLCMDLIKQGAIYIGDDLVLVYLNRGQAMVGSLLFPIKYFANGINSHKKKRDIVSLLHQKPPLNVPMKHLYYFLQRSNNPNDESYLKPMKDATMFEKMLKLTNRANTNTDANHFVDTISSICTSIPSNYLFYGDPKKTGLSFFTYDDQK